MSKAEPSDISFEHAMQELEQIVQQLEQGDLPLEQALQQFEKAVKLSRISQQKLQQAEQKVSILMQQQGETKLAEFDSEQAAE